MESFITDQKVVKVSGRTVMNHLEIEWLSLIDIVEVFHGDDQAQLQNGQT